MKFNLRKPKFTKPDIRLPLDLTKIEKLDREHYNLVAWGLGAIIVLMVVAGFAAFFLSLRGAEETMVPDVKGMELASALVKLQDKELYPRLSLRFTDDPADKGRIVEQKPQPGTIVKAGRRINLVVSRGPIVDKLENYVGQDLNEVKIHLQTLFASATALVTIKEPPVYVFDKAPAGTILEQKPPAETKVDGPVALELVVSRGPALAQISVPDLTGLSFSDALLQIEKANVAVTFTMRKADSREKAGTVVTQTPTPGSLMPPNGRITATITAPQAQEGMVPGIFERDLPEYAYPLKVTLEVLLPTGERRLILRVNHPGGKFSVPYFLPKSSILILSVLDRESARMEVLGQ